MDQQTYEFFDDYIVRVRGDGGRTSGQFSSMFDRFKTSGDTGEPNLVIEETTDDPDPEIVLGTPEEYYGREKDRFIVKAGPWSMSVRSGWEHVAVSPNFEPFWAIYPMEFKIRQRMVASDMALIHGSGVEFDGETTLFPAWRSGGKTNTLLALLREGAGFLSDDRLWVSSDGSAVGYHLGINLHSHNIDSFPELTRSYDSTTDRVRHEVHDILDAQFDTSGSLPETAVSILNDKFLANSGRDFVEIDSLYPEVDYVSESTVDNLVFLQAAPNRRTVTAEEISVAEAMAQVTAISNFEWDGQLREYFHAYDSLIDGAEMVNALDELISAERDIFRTLFSDVSLYRASIPRHSNWEQAGLNSAVVDMVSSLDSRRESTPKAKD